MLYLGTGENVSMVGCLFENIQQNGEGLKSSSPTIFINKITSLNIESCYFYKVSSKVLRFININILNKNLLHLLN